LDHPSAVPRQESGKADAAWESAVQPSLPLDASDRAMVLALAITLLLSWLLLWGIFHLAGGIIHAALGVGFALLVYRIIRNSDLRRDS